MPVADAATLAPMVDGVILVVRPGVTTLTAARQSAAQLRQVNARLLGVVLNAVRLNGNRYGYTYYKKGYNTGKYYGGKEGGNV